MDTQKFEKWRAICAIVSAVGGVLAWEACQRGWCVCVSGVLAWLTCQRGWRASVSYVDSVLGWRASVGGMGGAPVWVKGKVCQRGWHGWCTKVSSLGDIGGNTRMVCYAISWVAHYFSNSFLKLTGNEYSSKPEK